MNAVAIRRCSPRDPGASALLRASHGVMEPVFPSSSNHDLSIDGLCMPGSHFFVAERGGRSLGCIALAERNGYAEIKSMFVDPDARGLGIGDSLLDHVTAIARERGHPLLRLETGKGLAAAHRLYLRHGFRECESFGDHPESTHSTFMERAL